MEDRFTLSDLQFQQIASKIEDLMTLEDGFYKKKYQALGIAGIQSKEDFFKLPFTEKGELREAYPLGIQAVADEDIVRIHSSSGTTGTAIIIPYTKQDLKDWHTMFKRCYEMAGVTNKDRVQITPGYGLWTAGISFQAGCEELGAMAIPMGPGNTGKQLRMMADLKATVLCATSSYALLIAEEIAKNGVGSQICLKKGIIGSERWGEKMRRRIAEELGVQLYDIYGLTEIYGPGIGISCDEEAGIHYWDDYIFMEIIDPITLQNVEPGEVGEIVITTLRKEGAPLIRYRTHDLSRFIPGECPCGCGFPRIDTLTGRTDDMVKVKGVNIYPGQIEDVLKQVDGVSSEYKVTIDRIKGKDILTLYFELREDADQKASEAEVLDLFKKRVGLTIQVRGVDLGELPRSEKKSTRIFDNRY